MSPFTEGPYKTDEGDVTAIGAELKRLGLADPDSKVLRELTEKLIRQSSHNLDVVATKLSRHLVRKHDLQHALCLLYVKAIRRELYPDQTIVGGHIRGGQSHGPVTSEVTEPATKRGPRIKQEPPKPSPYTRPVGAGVDAIEKVFWTGDRKNAIKLSYSEFVARAMEGRKYQAIIDHIGSPPVDTSVAIETLVAPAVFEKIWNG